MSTAVPSRVGTADSYATSVRNLMTRQTTLSNMEDQLTSGKRVVRASDDPIAAAQAERDRNRMARITADQRALQAQQTTIAQGESTLGTATTLLQAARELIVNAGDGSLTVTDRATIANQLQSLREQLVDVVNRTDSNGIPMLGALGSALKPFLGPQLTTPDYTYDGLPGQKASTEVGIPNMLDGNAAFMFNPLRDGVYTASVSAIPAGSTRTLTTDVIKPTVPATVPTTGDNYQISFSNVVTDPATGAISGNYTVTDTTTGAVLTPVPAPDPTTLTVGSTTSGAFSFPAATVKTTNSIPITEVPGLTFNISGTPDNGDTVTMQPSMSIFSTLDAAIAGIGHATDNNAALQAVGQALGNLDKGMAQVSTVRGLAGQLLNRADQITSDQANRTLQLETHRSQVEDLDMVKAISDFQTQQTGYSAALQSYAQIQKLSLFNYLG